MTRGFTFSMPARTIDLSSSSGVPVGCAWNSSPLGLNFAQHGRAYFSITHAVSSQSPPAGGGGGFVAPCSAEPSPLGGDTAVLDGGFGVVVREVREVRDVRVGGGSGG